MVLTKEQFARFIQRRRWKFAKTMPHWPHEYTVTDWRPDEQQEFQEAVRFIQETGVTESFSGKDYRYVYVDGWKYWTMGAAPEETILINRTQS